MHLLMGNVNKVSVFKLNSVSRNHIIKLREDNATRRIRSKLLFYFFERYSSNLGCESVIALLHNRGNISSSSLKISTVM